MKGLIALFSGIAGFFLMLVFLSETAVGYTNISTTTNTPLMVEYPIPLAITKGINGEPRHIVIQESGHSWFTLPASNQIGELVVTSTVDYQFHVYNIPTANSEPHDLVYDGNNIWFTAKAANQIGQIDLTTKTVITYAIPTPNSSPLGIAKAPDGRVWFVNNSSNNLSVFNPITPTEIIEYPILCQSNDPANLEEIAIAPNNSIWITAPGCNRVFRFNPDTATITERILVGTFFGDIWVPGSIIVGRNNSPWITAPSEDLFAFYAPGTLALWRWRDYIDPVPSQLSDIAFSTANAIDHVWIAEKQNNRIGLLLTTLSTNDLSFREFSLPSASSSPHSIAVDDANHAWITASGINTIVEWSPPYFYNTYLPLILKSEN